MRNSSLTKWLASLRAPSVPKPRRAKLGVQEFERRLVPASLAGNVFVDLNNNGVHDAGEPGIAGVKVHLVGKTNGGQVVSLDAVTDCQGNYKFDNLAGGDYAVSESQPAGFKDGKDAAGSAGGFAIGSGAIVCIHLNDCTNACGYNFGELPACQTNHNGSDGKGSGGRGSHDKGDGNQSHSKGSGGKGSNSKGSGGKGSGAKGSHDSCNTGSHAKGSGSKGSGGKGSGAKGSHDRSDSNQSHGKGSNNKGSHDKGNSNQSHGKGSANKGSAGKGDHKGNGSAGKC